MSEQTKAMMKFTFIKMRQDWEEKRKVISLTMGFANFFLFTGITLLIIIMCLHSELSHKEKFGNLEIPRNNFFAMHMQYCTN